MNVAVSQLGDADDYWFQQDGATMHTGRVTIMFLKKNFRNPLIFENGDLR